MGVDNKMSNEVRPYVLCPECGSGSKRVHTDKDVEDAVKDLKGYSINMTAYNLKRQWICSECSYVFELSALDMINAYSLKRRLEGKQDKDIKKELEEKLEKSKREV